MPCAKITINKIPIDCLNWLLKVNQLEKAFTHCMIYLGYQNNTSGKAFPTFSFFKVVALNGTIYLFIF